MNRCNSDTDSIVWMRKDSKAYLCLLCRTITQGNGTVFYCREGGYLKDKEYMAIALAQAELARGKTSPNPLVGCVLVNAAGEIVGKGYHHKAGQPHAEVNALADAGEKSRGATAYVTLEPCSHYGRTGPCCEALIKAGVKKVVAAANDPNPKVAGKGFARLREAGVVVEQGLLEKEALRQNEVFMHWMTTGKAFVALKYAMTLDGKIATATGDSKWITGVEARSKGHYLRSIYDGIVVGKNTVLKDDPALTCRLVEGKNPIRIVLDSKLSLPTTCQVFTDKAAPTIVVVGAEVAQTKQEAFAKATGVRVLPVPTKAGRIDITALLKILGKENITSVLVEGGSQVHGAFVDAKEVSRVYAFLAPKLLGGSQSITPVGGAGHDFIKQGLQLTEMECIRLGEDLMVSGIVKEGE